MRYSRIQGLCNFSPDSVPKIVNLLQIRIVTLILFKLCPWKLNSCDIQQSCCVSFYTAGGSLLKNKRENPSTATQVVCLVFDSATMNTSHAALQIYSVNANRHTFSLYTSAYILWEPF